jgi:hypothetical protein
MAGDRTTPMRALASARAVRRRAGEHALARAVGGEREAATREATALAARDGAAGAVDRAREAVRALVAAGADAATLARGDAYTARLRARLADAEADLSRAREERRAAAAATGASQRELAGAVAEAKVAERALGRAVDDQRRARERREDD